MENYKKLVYNLNWDRQPTYESKNLKGIDFRVPSNKDIGIIIDNGSYECRAGWSISESPNLIFKSLVAKPKVTNKTQPKSLYVGNEILSIEQGKLNKKSPFEKNIVTHFHTQEHIFDYIFKNLNISDESVNHPITITEAFCNVNWSRKNLTEMIFELYQAPSLAYGIDFQFSFLNELKSQNLPVNSNLNALIISSSYQTTHIVPIINGKINIDKSRRISLGGYHSFDLLTKSLHLRYPDFKNKITNEVVEDIIENYCVAAKNYRKQLNLLESIFRKEQENLKEDEKIRMFGSLKMYQNAMNINPDAEKNKFGHLSSYTNIVDYYNQKIDEDNQLVDELAYFDWPTLTANNIVTEEDLIKKQEIRNEQSKRLREIMQKKKEQNIKNLEKELNELESISLLKDSSDSFHFEETLLSKGFNNFEAVQKRINKIYMKIQFNKEVKDDEKIDEEKKWPLINVPDEDLTEEQLKLKRMQKMHRNAYLARIEKREILKKEKDRVEELKQNDPEKYLIGLYKKKKELFEKIENYKQTRKEFQNRHSKINQKRMRVLAELGKENEKSRKNNTPDEFGIKDEDWEIYRGISRHNLSEDEEEDVQQLNEVEAQIIEMDPNYFKNLENSQNKIFGQNLFLGVDQFRCSELIFKPSLIGVDQAGLIEIILSIFKTMTKEEIKNLCKCIFLTGGNMNYKYIEDRIKYELKGFLDCDVEINVLKANDPKLDAWKGAREFFNDKANAGYYMTKNEYFEYGPEYFKEHFSSNLIPFQFHQTNSSIFDKNEFPNKRKKE